MNELSAQVAIAQQIAARIHEEIDDDDPDFFAILESETDVVETLRRLLRRARRAEAEAEATAYMRRELMDELKAREERHAHRAEALRRAVIWAMGELDMPKVTAADFTATVSTPAHGGVEIPDSDAVPIEFCRVKKEPDKAKIKQLLDGGERVNWASFAPAMPKLTIRTR